MEKNNLTTGTEVLIDSIVGGGKGTIAEKVGENSSGAVYKVKTDDNKIMTISEAWLRPKEIDDRIKEDKQKAIDTEINKIIQELHLTSPQTLEEKLDVCCKVHWYIVNNNHYNKDMLIVKQKSSNDLMGVNELYQAVVEKESVCSGNSLEFQEILSKLGVKAETVILKDDSKSEIHMSNLVELDNQYYFFDSTLDYYYNTFFQDNGMDKKMYCAGMGSNFYMKMYTPLYIIDAYNLALKDLPQNIAVDNISPEVTNKILTSTGEETLTNHNKK